MVHVMLFPMIKFSYFYIITFRSIIIIIIIIP
jgi:hypothetical protein